ncbi:MAG: 2Fe-2S iron-sulfur cluster binding domain-containing protein [Rhizobiaceae bacterium]|nr:2Fe-2S iron-sulfur cluster binding domain-containing protein [Rhizobiaceae bacterium]
MVDMSLSINGRVEHYRVTTGEMLIDILRRSGLTGTKDGCRRGECGACTVLVGGRAVLSCLTFAQAVSAPVETVEGLAGEATAFREALADLGGFQCGYCTSGMVVRAISLIREGLQDDDGELRHRMAGNLCRCTGYQGILNALRVAAGAQEVA